MLRSRASNEIRFFLPDSPKIREILEKFDKNKFDSGCSSHSEYAAVLFQKSPPKPLDFKVWLKENKFIFRSPGVCNVRISITKPFFESVLYTLETVKCPKKYKYIYILGLNR